MNLCVFDYKSIKNVLKYKYSMKILKMKTM